MAHSNAQKLINKDRIAKAMFERRLAAGLARNKREDSLAKSNLELFLGDVEEALGRKITKEEAGYWAYRFASTWSNGKLQEQADGEGSLSEDFPDNDQPRTDW